MKTYVTRYTDDKATYLPQFNFSYMSAIPEGFDTDLIFDFVEFPANDTTKPETNEVQKTFIMIKGTGTMSVNGEEIFIEPGEIFWMAKGSVFTVTSGDEEVLMLCVKKRA